MRNRFLIYRMNDGLTSFTNLLIESINSSFRRKDARKRLAWLKDNNHLKILKEIEK